MRLPVLASRALPVLAKPDRCAIALGRSRFPALRQWRHFSGNRLLDQSQRNHQFCFLAGLSYRRRPTGASRANRRYRASGANRSPGPQGTTGTAGAIGWTANVLIPAQTDGYSAPPVGTTTAVASFQATAVPLPQACLASNFSVNVISTNSTTPVNVALVYADASTLLMGYSLGTALSCTATPNTYGANGQIAGACSSTGSLGLAQNQFLSLQFTTSDGSEFASTRAFVSFTCQ